MPSQQSSDERDLSTEECGNVVGTASLPKRAKAASKVSLEYGLYIALLNLHRMPLNLPYYIAKMKIVLSGAHFSFRLS